MRSPSCARRATTFCLIASFKRPVSEHLRLINANSGEIRVSACMARSRHTNPARGKPGFLQHLGLPAAHSTERWKREGPCPSRTLPTKGRWAFGNQYLARGALCGRACLQCPIPKAGMPQCTALWRGGWEGQSPSVLRHHGSSKSDVGIQPHPNPRTPGANLRSPWLRQPTGGPHARPPHESSLVPLA